MPGLNASLYLGLTGLQAQQSALNVVGHNIANVNTPGYTRQRAGLSSNFAQIEGQVYFGTGVSLTSVQGIRDRFLDLQIYRETARQSGAEERFSGINALSTSLGDTGSTGLGAQIQAFFQGFQTLSAQPEDAALRTNLLGKAQSMISSFKSQYQRLADQRTSADQSVASLVKEVNTLTEQIAQLNKQISVETTPGSNNDARDQRKALTDKLATLIGINVFEGSQGEYQISLDSGKALLVSGNASFNLQAITTDPALDGHLRVESLMGGAAVDVTSAIKDGQLGGKLDLRDNILLGYQQQLDQLAAGVAAEVNKLHYNGFGGSNGLSTNNYFFTGGTPPDGTNVLPPLPATIPPPSNSYTYKGMVDALSVAANIASDPSLIATSDVSGALGNNVNAKAIANLQFASGTVDTDGNGVGDSGPYSTVVGNLVSDVGTQEQSYDLQNSTEQNLVAALQTQRDRMSGVDLNEEATNMMTLQRGYQASARFISVINQLTDQLVNQFGK